MKAYIFDLDGTLLDSMGVWSSIDVEFLEKRGLAVPDDYFDKISAMGFSQIAAYTIERFGLPDTVDGLLREWSDMAAYAYGNTVRMKPHAREYLSELRDRGAKLAVATSAIPDLCALALRSHGIHDWFDVVCNSNEVGCGKSRPDVFLLAAQRLGVAPHDCMVFEDILDAVRSAKSVGMTVCGVYDKASESDWDRIRAMADYSILDFRDAPRWPAFRDPDLPPLA